MPRRTLYSEIQGTYTLTNQVGYSLNVFVWINPSDAYRFVKYLLEAESDTVRVEIPADESHTKADVRKHIYLRLAELLALLPDQAEKFSYGDSLRFAAHIVSNNSKAFS